jgi:hypothetical protein
MFLRALRDEHPRLCADVSAEVCGRYLDREGYFADTRGSEAPRKLEEAALDVYWLVQRFGSHPSVKAMPSFQILARLYSEPLLSKNGGSRAPTPHNGA